MRAGGSEAPRRRPTCDLLIGLGLVGLAIAYFSLTKGWTLNIRDEGYFLNFAVDIVGGRVPHRDFADIYGPGSHVPAALVIEAFGRSLLAVRWLLVGVKSLTVGLIFAIGRRVVPLPWAVAGSLAAMAWWGRPSWVLDTPYPSLYSISLGLLTLYALLEALRRRSLPTLALAGFLAGFVLFFKQSLGLAFAYAAGLATWAVTMLEAPSGGRAADRAVALALWSVTGALVVLPFAGTLTLADYGLHLLPLHLAMGLVAAAVVRRGSDVRMPVVLGRLGVLVGGWAVAVALLVLPYAIWGSLGELATDMVVVPRSLVGYQLPVVLDQPIPSISLLIALVAAVTAALLAMHRSRRGASIALAVAGASALFVAGWPPSLDRFGHAARILLATEALQPAAIAIGTMLLLAPVWLRPGSPSTATSLLAVPLLFFHAAMTFQIFPRAGRNLFIMQAGIVPLGIFALDRWHRLGADRGADPGRRLLAAALVAALPLAWMVPSVTWWTVPREGARALAVPGAEGITLDAPMARFNRIDGFEAVIRHLADLEPPNGPILLLTVDEMISFLSGRPALHPERRLQRYLASQGFLAADRVEEIDVAELLRRLEMHPEAIVVRSNDPRGRRLRAATPELEGFLIREYRVSRRIGVYEVLTRRP